MINRPITNYLDMSLFPNEKMELKGEKYLLKNSDEGIIKKPGYYEGKLNSFDPKTAKNKILFRQSRRTINISLDMLIMLAQNHNLGAVELRNTLNTMITALESLNGNNKAYGFDNLSLSKFRGIKMWITRRPRFKTWARIYEALNTMTKELPMMEKTITVTMWEVHRLITGTHISLLNNQTWTKIMREKPFTIII